MDQIKPTENITEEKNSNFKKIEIKSKEEEQNEEKQLFVPVSRKMRWTVYSFLTMITIIMGLDQGILSSTTSELQKDFKMDERKLGGLGGMIFLGSAIGCLCSFALINKFNRKYLLLASMSLDVLCLFLTTQTTNLVLLYLCRTIAGFTQSFLSIYSPVWSDQFGIHKYKSIMLALIHLSSSLGYLFGYVMGILFSWESSFYIQNIIIIIHIVIIFIFIPDKYFSMNLMPLKAKLQLEKLSKKEEKEKKENNEIINEINDIKLNINEVDNYEEKKEKLIDEKIKEEEEKNIEKEEDTESLFEDIKVNNEDITKESFLTHLKILIKSPIYILMNITLTSMFMIVSAIQFWISDYMENGLLIENEKVRLYGFAAVVVTSPPAGIILGGILSGKVGGYDTEKAIYIPLITSFFVSVLANITPLFTKLYFFLPCFWTYLFLGSVLLPVARGIVLVSVDKKYNGPANAVSTLLYSVLGRLPGPNLYAFYKSRFSDKHSRIPFWLLLNMAVPGFLATLVCVKFQKEKYKKLKNKGNNEEEKENIIENEDKKGKEVKKEVKEENDENEEKEVKEEKDENEEKDKNEEKDENKEKEEKEEIKVKENKKNDKNEMDNENNEN